MPESKTGYFYKRRECITMKKLLVLWFVFIFLIACELPCKKSGVIEFKGVDKIDIEALFDSLKIKSEDTDTKYIEMFWVKIKGIKGKVYINQFCYENYKIDDEINFEDCKDIRFGEE